jgi:hypothetical protein
MRTRLLLLALAVAASLSAGCTDSDPYGLKDLPPPPPEQSASTTATGAGSAKVAPSRLGQPATVGTWLLVAKTADRSAEVGEVKAKDGKELLVVSVDLTNGGALDDDTHQDFFTLVGPDGAEHKAVKSDDPTFIHVAAQQPVTAGEVRELFILFSVDKGDGPFQLMYLPMSEEGKNQPAAIDLE